LCGGNPAFPHQRDRPTHEGETLRLVSFIDWDRRELRSNGVDLCLRFR
jgi:hypothetical protein